MARARERGEEAYRVGEDRRREQSVIMMSGMGMRRSRDDDCGVVFLGCVGEIGVVMVVVATGAMPVLVFVPHCPCPRDVPL